MTKMRYPVTEQYVKNWGIVQAIREIIANGFDAEVEHHAPFSTDYDSAKKILTVTNQGVTLPVEALYFGGTTKSEKAGLIGQYGEGLKIALLIFAREKFKVVIRNGRNETWVPSMEADKNGVVSLCIDVKKANRIAENFDVEMHGIDLEAWNAIRNLFLKLNPPVAVTHTSYGDIINDAEYVGRIYAKGVFATTKPNMNFGYNFSTLELGRDRSMPGDWEIGYYVSQMWGSQVGHNIRPVLDMFEQDGPEAQAFKDTKTLAMSNAVVQAFRQKHGEDAVPIIASAEATSLEHVGVKGVMVPRSLASLLFEHMKTSEQVLADRRSDTVKRYALTELEAGEVAVITQALKVLRGTGKLTQDPGSRIIVCDFRSEAIEGLHSGQDVFLARSILKDFGKTLMVSIHEFAHDFGGDGTKAHVDGIHMLTEAAMNWLWRQT